MWFRAYWEGLYKSYSYEETEKEIRIGVKQTCGKWKEWCVINNDKSQINVG